jgi:hypothetical protein
MSATRSNSPPQRSRSLTCDRFLHRGEDAAPDQQRQRQRCGGTRGVGEQQECGSDIRALQRRAGQDQAEHGAGAGRPEKAGGDTEQQRRQQRFLAGLFCRLRQPRADGDQGLHQPVGEGRKQQGEPEHGQQDQRRHAAILIGRHHPAAGDRRQARDHGKCQRHADQHRQAAAQERTIGARQHERNHRQDARAHDGQHAAEIGEKKQDHWRLTALFIYLRSPTLACYLRQPCFGE